MILCYQDLVSKFNFHHYDNLKFTAKKIDPCVQKIESRATEVVNLLFSAYNCDVSALRRYEIALPFLCNMLQKLQFSTLCCLTQMQKTT